VSLTHQTITVEVEMNDLDVNYFDDTLSFDCLIGYYEFYTPDENTQVYDENETPVSYIYPNYYQLDAINHQYKTIYTDIEGCSSDETTLHFEDVPVQPETPSVWVYSDFNTETDTCAYVKTEYITCHDLTLEVDQEVEIYD